MAWLLCFYALPMRYLRLKLTISPSRPGLTLPFRPLARLAQDEERRSTRSEARSRKGLGKGALAMSVVPEGRRNRIMIYGLKNDGTYIVEFKTADGEALAISVPVGGAEALPGADALWAVRARGYVTKAGAVRVSDERYRGRNRIVHLRIRM
jgi:hypothetical protein